jgi:hypothetical protein
VTSGADVYALGLILNEAFTGEIPIGTEYKTISSVSENFGFLDVIVSSMIRQSADSRPKSIFDIKAQISKAQNEIAYKQKISKIDSTVVLENTIDDPLAITPPLIASASWDSGQLEIIFDCEISEGWIISGLHKMGSYGSVLGIGPQQLHFVGNKAYVSCPGEDAQRVITYLKDWLPKATMTYKRLLEEQLLYAKQQALAQLRREKAIEEERFHINSRLQL